MFMSLRHPSFHELNRYVDDDLPEHRRRRVATHLARCKRCRETVTRLRAIGTAARDLPVPAPPANLLELTLQRRAAGDRVILPLTPPGAPRRRRLAWPIAAAMAALVVAAILTLVPPALQAARGGLTITPARPEAGTRLSFDYTDTGRFQGQQRLVVRARYRTKDQRFVTTAAILDRAADGHFQGTARLPDSVVYAAFAVEDPAGRTVDSNGRRYWDVMVHGPDGRPTFYAIAARLDDLYAWDWEGAFDVARQMTRLYPERPASWAALATFERAVEDDVTILPRLEKRLDAIRQTILAEDDPDPETLAELAFVYAFPLGRLDESRRIVGRIRADHAWLQLRARYRVSLSWIAADGNRTRYLANLDSLWNQGVGDARMAQAGLRSSVLDGNPDLAWRWYQRLAVVDPGGTVGALTEELLPVPSLRARAVNALERAVSDSTARTPNTRYLYLSVPEYERMARRRMGRAKVAVGTALATYGRTAEALKLLRAGIDDVWTPAMLHQAGRILLAHGDTAGAIDAYARMAADPALSPDLHRAINEDLGAITRSQHWNARVASARAALREAIFAERITTPVDTAMVLGDPSGKPVALSRLMSPGATAVVFWSSQSLPALDSSQRMETVRQRLAAFHIRTIVIDTSPRRAERGQASKRQQMPFPVYTDLHGQAARDFGPPGTPSYYVLDGEGRIRFAHSSLDRLVEQAVMLRDDSMGPVSAAE